MTRSGLKAALTAAIVAIPAAFFLGQYTATSSGEAEGYRVDLAASAGLPEPGTEKERKLAMAEPVGLEMMVRTLSDSPDRFRADYGGKAVQIEGTIDHVLGSIGGAGKFSLSLHSPDPTRNVFLEFPMLSGSAGETLQSGRPLKARCIVANGIDKMNLSLEDCQLA